MTDNNTILCLDGDGISTELISAVRAVLDASCIWLHKPLTLVDNDVGLSSLDTHGTTITQHVLRQAEQADAVILGPVSHNQYPDEKEGGLNPSAQLRNHLSLFANIRPAKTYSGLTSYSSEPFDLVIMRENLEGFYADRNMASGSGEFMPVDGVALAMRKITRQAVYDIAQAAFKLADQRQAKHVTAIHKANVLRLTDGLFLDTVRSVASSYPHIQYDEMLVDAAAAQLVRAPSQFDVIVTTNMFGDILSDLASELSGSLGLAGSLNVGHTAMMAQAQHGSAPDIAGQNKANPTSLILSTAMMLTQLGEDNASTQIRCHIHDMLTSPNSRTADLGGTLSCSEFTDQLCHRLSEKHSHSGVLV